MSPSDIFKLAAQNPHEWFVVKPDFSKTLVAGELETVKDASASAAVGGDVAPPTLVLTSAATTDDDGALVQSTNEFFKPTAGKRAALSVSMKVSDHEAIDMFFGWAQTAATNPEACLTASNRMGFQVNDGNASILLKSEASDIENSADSEVDIATDTYVKLELYFDGSRIHFYIDGNGEGSMSAQIPATELGISMFHLSGNDSGTKSSTWKNLICAVEL